MILRGELDKIKEVIDKGVPLNEDVYYGDTPLLYAIAQAKTSIAKLLIEKGADVNYEIPTTGKTALMEAAYEGNLEVVRTLLRAGANLNHQDKNGLPALCHALGKPAIVEELIAAGADVNAPFGEHWRDEATILMRAENLNTIKILLAAGADVNVVKNRGTPLTCAIAAKDAARVALLLEGGGDPNLRLRADHPEGDVAGKTALDYARELGLSKIVALLEAGTPSKKAQKSPTKRAAEPLDVKGIWRRIEAILEAQAPEIKKSLNNGATKKALRKLETLCRVSLPDDFKVSYLLHDGQNSGQESLIREGVFTKEGYVLMPLEYIVAEWKSWKELETNGEFSGQESVPDGGIQPVWWHPAWISFASNGGGDSLCIDMAPANNGTKGQVISMNHETAQRQLIAKSLTEFLSKLADHLAEDAAE